MVQKDRLVKDIVAESIGDASQSVVKSVITRLTQSRSSLRALIYSDIVKLDAGVALETPTPTPSPRKSPTKRPTRELLVGGGGTPQKRKAELEQEEEEADELPTPSESPSKKRKTALDAHMQNPTHARQDFPSTSPGARVTRQSSSEATPPSTPTRPHRTIGATTPFFTPSPTKPKPTQPHSPTKSSPLKPRALSPMRVDALEEDQDQGEESQGIFRPIYQDHIQWQEMDPALERKLRDVELQSKAIPKLGWLEKLKAMPVA